MTISGSGANINYNPQPSIFEQTTTGAEELRRQGAMGLNSVVIQPDTTATPLPQLVNRNLWNYKSESSRPNLRPAGSFRAAGAEGWEREEGAKQIFDELIKQLPKDVQKGILEGEEKEYQALKNLLQNVSKQLDVQRGVAEKLETKDMQDLLKQIDVFVEGLFLSGFNNSEGQIGVAKKTLDILTPNDPDYLESLELLNNLKNFMSNKR